MDKYSIYYPPKHPDKVQIIRTCNGVFTVEDERSLESFKVMARLLGIDIPDLNDSNRELTYYGLLISHWFQSWLKLDDQF